MEYDVVSDGAEKGDGPEPVADLRLFLLWDVLEGLVGEDASVSGIEPDGGGALSAQVLIEPHVMVSDYGKKVG